MDLSKYNAIFIIIIIVLSTISFPTLAPEVKAQENKECCEKTTSGDYCVYTDASQCDQSSQHAPTTCENTDYCSPGCCFDSDSGDCFNNVAYSECKSTGTRTFQKGDCSQVSQCSIGCCQLSNQAFISTATKCKQVTSQYPNVQMHFDPSIQDEYACVASVRSGVKGCCVKAPGQCSFTTASDCGVQTTLPPPPQQAFPNFNQLNCIQEGNPVDSSLNQQCCQGLTPVPIQGSPDAKPICRSSQNGIATGSESTTVQTSFPPQITIISPQGTVNQLATTFQISTDQPANCRYDTQDKSFDQMTNSFSITGGNSHSAPISNLVNGNAYTYYVRCKNTQNMETPTSAVINFNVNTQSQITGQVVANFDQNTPVEQKTGFFEGVLCSSDQLPCQVAKENHLGCYNEDVYWFDSGNNPENVFLGNSQEKKAQSYNNGKVIADADSLCKATPNDQECGNCDYTLGTLCGEKDGVFLCQDLNCKDTTKDPNSADATGGNKELGQSWCLYDGPIGPDEYGASQDRVGSRHFRTSCINGEEITEPCKDFREELCTQSYSNGQSTNGDGTSLFYEVTKNLPTLPGSSSPLSNIFNPSKDNFGASDTGYSEAACRQNRFDTCAQCNTLTSQSKVKSCCSDISQRDCSFMQSGVTNKGGICVPLVKPGIRFWGDNSLISSRQSTTNNPTGGAVVDLTGEQFANTQSPTQQQNTPTSTNQQGSSFFGGNPQQATQPTGSPQTTPQIAGNPYFGGTGIPTNTQGVNANSNTGNDICSQASIDCDIGFTRGGVSHILGRSDWKCTYNCQCLTDDAFTAAHSLCRSIGDCGAYFNYVGVFTEGGFDIKAEGPKGALAIPDNMRQQFMDRARPNLLKYALEKPPQTGGGPKKPGFGDFFKKSAIPLAVIGGTALYGLASGGLSGLAGGFLLGPMTVVSFITPGSTTAALGSTLQGAGFGNTALVGRTYTLANGGGLSTLSGSTTIPAGTTVTIPQTTLDANPGILGNLGVNTQGTLTPTAGVYTVKTGNDVTAQTLQGINGANIGGPQGGIIVSGPQATGWGYALGIANAIAWIWSIYELVDWLAADTKTGKVGFICKAWEAPDGGADCNKCNDDKKPCSEYRCKSLGKLCQIVNQGTDHEICTNIQPNDASSPRIKPNKDYMKGYQIQEEPDRGFTITNKIPPFTPITLGLITDEAAQCKFSNTPSDKVAGKDAFDAMNFDFGSSLFLFSHNMTLMLPSDLATQQAVQLTNGGQYTIYVRCKDPTGNANNRDYYIKFAIDQGPDLSPPVITSTSITSGSYVKSDLTQVPIDIFVNELATCKWQQDRDIDYDAMQNQFTCISSGTDLSTNGGYKCSTQLNIAQAQGVPSSQNQIQTQSSGEATPTPGNTRNVYYFRCKDKSGNKDNQGYPYTLVSSVPLQIVNVTPQGELKTGNNIILSVTTDKGSESGRAICGYSQQQDTPFTNMPAFVNTLSTTSTQPLEKLAEGNYKFYITCEDRAGNEANNVSEFSIKADHTAPKPVSVFQESGTLHVTTDEPSTCQYSDKDFSFGSGSDMTNPDTTDHEAAITGQLFIIKCMDEFNNLGTFTVNTL